MTPPGLSQRSRAAITGTSIPSSIPNPPSHSETITSTRSGSAMSITSPWITSTMSPNPFAAGQLLRKGGDRRPFDGVDTRGARPRAANALEDAAPRTNVENDVAGAHDRIDRASEGSVRTRSQIIVRCTSISAYIGSGGFLIGVRTAASSGSQTARRLSESGIDATPRADSG